jgi:hypothetical protein
MPQIQKFAANAMDSGNLTLRRGILQLPLGGGCFSLRAKLISPLRTKSPSWPFSINGLISAKARDPSLDQAMPRPFWRWETRRWLAASTFNP